MIMKKSLILFGALFILFVMNLVSVSAGSICHTAYGYYNCRAYTLDAPNYYVMRYNYEGHGPTTYPAERIYMRGYGAGYENGYDRGYDYGFIDGYITSERDYRYDYDSYNRHTRNYRSTPEFLLEQYRIH